MISLQNKCSRIFSIPNFSAYHFVPRMCGRLGNHKLTLRTKPNYEYVSKVFHSTNKSSGKTNRHFWTINRLGIGNIRRLVTSSAVLPVTAMRAATAKSTALQGKEAKLAHTIPPKMILREHNESAVRKVLQQEVPDLRINTIELNTSGWDNLVANVNGDDWIFRFPREEKFLPMLERERILLDHLKNKVSMPIPYYQYVGARTAFVGYRKILGESLTEELYLAFTDVERQAIAKSLALFFTQLHHGVSVEEATQWGYPKYHIPLQEIEQSLLKTSSCKKIKRMLSEALAYTKQTPCSTEKPVLLHCDVHGGNLAYNRNTKKMGVFDFSFAAIGNSFSDFAMLFHLHQDLALRTLKEYASLNKIANYPAMSAAADYVMRQGFFILEGIKNGDASREATVVAELEHFAPVWNSMQHPTSKTTL